jgi:hypothetical protein
MQLTQDATAPAQSEAFGLKSPFREIFGAWLGIGVVLVAVSLLGVISAGYATERYFFLRQDLPMLFLCIGVVWGAGLAAQQGALKLAIPTGPRLVFALALICGFVGALGARLLFHGYVLSLDEFLANFDAKIFARGKLLAPVDPAWRPFERALQPMYMLPVPSGDVWASSYLPVNAAIRALAGKVGLEWLVNPLLSGFAVVAVYGIARRLWPEDEQGRVTATVAAALLATSPQLIVMSMTAYAMAGHLAFNLAWLWLFLRGGKAGHGGAILIGFLAAGLHQLLHPLFVAPFIADLWLGRRRLAMLYTVAYAAFGIFWIEYWPLEMHLLGERSSNAGALGGGFLIQRVHEVLSAVRPRNLCLMAESLTRFVTWQNPMTAPLIVLGVIAAVRAKGVIRNLAIGVLLTLFAMLILVPTQTDGWGYRYLHGLLGSISLIVAWTWVNLTRRLGVQMRSVADHWLVVMCALSLLALTPIRIWEAWNYVRPYAVVNSEIEATRAPVVIIDHYDEHGFDPGTLVRNDPFLQQGPKVIQLSEMDEDLVRDVCARGPVEVFSGREAKAAGIDTTPLRANRDIVDLRVLMTQLKCGTLFH